MGRVLESLGVLQRAARSFGPYLMLEIVMPGGTLLALLLFLYRRRRFEAAGASRALLAITRALSSFVAQGLSIGRPC
jgi:hypothetical protein